LVLLTLLFVVDVVTDEFEENHPVEPKDRCGASEPGLPVSGKTELGTFGLSIPKGVEALNGGVGGKCGISLPGDRVSVVEVPVIPTGGRLEMDDAGDEEAVLLGGSNELAWRRIGGVGVRFPPDDPPIVDGRNCVAWGFEPAPSRRLVPGPPPIAMFDPRMLGVIMLLSRSCCICFWRFSCKSNREILCIKEGFFTTVAVGAASPPAPPARTEVDDDEEFIPPILEDPKPIPLAEVRELSLRPSDVTEDAALVGRPMTAPVIVSEEEERGEVRPWL
jgi:hypothetical protein